MSVRLLGLDGDGRVAVPESVRDQVRDDAVERLGVGVRLELGVNGELDVSQVLAGDHEQHLLEPRPDPEATRANLDRLCIEAREIEELVDE